MNNENDMPRKTISMNKVEGERLDDLAEEEHRTVSKQIVHMLDFYLKFKDKVK